MSKYRTCRLCIQICTKYRIIYDENGCKNRVNRIIAHYFSDVLSARGGNLTVICLDCWSQLSDFHNFKKKVVWAQTKLIEDEWSPKMDEEESISTLHDDFDTQMTTIAIHNEDNASDETELSDATGPSNELDEYDDPVGVFMGGEFTQQENSEPENREEYMQAQQQNCSAMQRESNIVDNTAEEATTTLRTLPIITENSLNHKRNLPPREIPIARTQEQASNFECDICKISCYSITLLQNHFLLEHPNENFYILCCQRRFYQQSRYEVHVRLLHESFKCNICSKIYRHSSDLDKHIATHTVSDIIHTCPHCSRTYRYKNSLRLHMIKKHATVGSFKCNICSKIYRYEFDFDKHIATHSDSYRVYRCQHCPSAYRSKNFLDRHMRLKHSSCDLNKHIADRAHKCSKCQKTYIHRSSLYAHVSLQHNAGGSHKCNICPKVFLRAIELNEHIATHTGINNYKCIHCPKTYRYRSTMYQHIIHTHHDYTKFHIESILINNSTE